MEKKSHKRKKTVQDKEGRKGEIPLDKSKREACPTTGRGGRGARKGDEILCKGE